MVGVKESSLESTAHASPPPSKKELASSSAASHIAMDLAICKTEYSMDPSTLAHLRAPVSPLPKTPETCSSAASPVAFKRDCVRRVKQRSRRRAADPAWHRRALLKPRAVLCIRDEGFTLTDGFVSYTMDRGDLHATLLVARVMEGVDTLIFTDVATKLRWEILQMPKEHAARHVPTFMLVDAGTRTPCPLCRGSRCHRHIAVQGIRQVLGTDKDVEAIPHHPV